MKSIFLAVVTSPALHFIVLGGIAFGLYATLKPPATEAIHVTTQTIDALVQQRESIVPNPVPPEERQSLIEGYIEDEVLLREAYKRGFDKTDYRVRKRLLNIMRSSLSDVVPEPSVAQLRTFYEENKERYLASPSRSFEQVYFSFTSNALPVDPPVFIRQLQGEVDIATLGEYAPMGNRFSKTSFQSAARLFGKPFAQIIFDLPLHQWHGPVESFRGIHYVRVTASHDSELPPFEQMESFLRSDYVMVKSRDRQQEKIRSLMKNYKIAVEGAN